MVEPDEFGISRAAAMPHASMNRACVNRPDTPRIGDLVRRRWRRNHLDVIQSVYSANELQDFVERGEASLRAAEVEVVWVHTGVDTGQIEGSLMTPDGQPDPDIESRARTALEGLPVVLTFSRPMRRCWAESIS